MRFAEAGLAGAFVVDPEPAADERGLFARSFCADESPRMVCRNPSCRAAPRSMRAAARCAACTGRPSRRPRASWCAARASSIYDVILDLRAGSPTLRQWRAFELTAENRRALYIPPGFAHGFHALADASEVFYEMTVSYAPQFARGARWNDPAFGIDWPIKPPSLSPRDASFPDWVA